MARLRIIVCGNVDRGDDGVGPLAADALFRGLPPSARRRLAIQHRSELDIVDLIDVPLRTGCVVVDAAVGVPPGHVITMSLAEIARRDGDHGPAPRSSHTLPIDQVLGLAARLDRLPDGLFVGVGGLDFSLGAPLSGPVAAALPALQTAIVDAIEALLEASQTHEAGAGRHGRTGPTIAVGVGGPAATVRP